MNNTKEDEEYEVWILPLWAADTIMETLALDSVSSSIDEDIRNEIQKACDETRTKSVPIKSRGGWISEFIRHHFESYEEYHDSCDPEDC